MRIVSQRVRRGVAPLSFLTSCMTTNLGKKLWKRISLMVGRIVDRREHRDADIQFASENSFELGVGVYVS